MRIRSHGLTRNVASEVKRSLVACAAGLDADRFRVKLEPAWTTKIPDGLDPCSVPKGVLAAYDLATRPVAFAAPKDQKAALAHDPDKYLAEADQQRDTIGSNNWVIAASRTATGRPILANDPHREHSVPSLRYIVGLNAPGLSVIGAGEPALPGISIGHNGTIAFGLTIFNVDQEDLYVYELNPHNPNQYRYGNGWEDMRIVHETEAGEGRGADRDLELKFTRHGPVIFVDDANKRAFAVRSIWFEPGTSAYFGSSDYMTAKDWNGFLGAMRRWGAPSENQVYADTKGNIGWVAAGKTPRRVNFDGLMPVPGDGRYEWQGFLSLDELPKVLSAEAGLVRHRQPHEPAARLSRQRAQGRLRMVRQRALAAHHRGARGQHQGDARRRHGSAERRHGHAGAPAGQAAAAADLRRCQCEAGPRSAQGVGRARHRRQRRGGGVRGLDRQSSRAGAAEDHGAQGRRSDRAGGLQHFGAHRRAGISGCVVRRRSRCRARPDPARQPRCGRGRCRKQARARSHPPGAGAGCMSQSSITR